MHTLVACTHSEDTQFSMDTNVRVILIHISNRTMASWQAFNGVKSSMSSRPMGQGFFRIFGFVVGGYSNHHHRNR